MGIKWPYWHILMFEGQETVDVRVVCPQDVKKMLRRQTTTVYWRRWPAKHECEELKEGVSLDPIQAMLRWKINDEWTEKHRKCDAKACCGRRLGAEKIRRCRLVKRKEMCRITRKSTDCTTVRAGRKSEATSQRSQGNGKQQGRIGSGKEESQRTNGERVI